MRIINVELIKAAGLEPCQKFFVDLWYGMTHNHSLDSYRVKCLNSHTIMRELSEELRIGLVNMTGRRGERSPGEAQKWSSGGVLNRDY